MKQKTKKKNNRKINKAKSWLLRRSTKLINLQSYWQEREGTQIINNKNKRGDITTNSTDVKIIIMEYDE